jgi:hypothetical protein
LSADHTNGGRFVKQRPRSFRNRRAACRIRLHAQDPRVSAIASSAYVIAIAT